MASVYDSEIPDHLQELFDLCEVFREKDGLKKLLEKLVNIASSLEVEEHLGAKRYQRTDQRRGQRNGTKRRSFNTVAGRLELDIPQVRNGEAYHPSFFNRWQRSQRALLAACMEMYFAGVSTRRVEGVIKEMCGLELSAGQVSRVAQQLDEQLAVFGERSLSGTEYPYLIVDARYEYIRCNGHVVSQAVLIAAGINSEGRREILDWRVANSESEESWKEVFCSLKDRGIKGVKLIVSDAHKGIKAAVNRHFQGVMWQRCRVHFMRELQRKTTWKNAKELMQDIRAVFRPEDRKECLDRAEEMAAKWEQRAPGVAKMLRADFEACLTVSALPAEHRRRLNTTNMLERVMRELKQRTRVIGIFPNAASCQRLIGARLMELNEGWQQEKTRYLSMELLDRQEYVKAV